MPLLLPGKKRPLLALPIAIRIKAACESRQNEWVRKFREGESRELEP